MVVSAALRLRSQAPKTREEMVADALRAAILRGTFKPGEKLDQQDLADSLGVSRSPVREALRTLAAEELVTLVPHRGAVVTERSPAELEELLFLRVLLEGAAAERAVPAVDDGRLAKLESIIERAEAEDDFEEVLELNNEFHSTIYSALDQPRVLAMIQKLRNTVAPYNRLYLDQPGRKDEAWADHRRIFEACKRRDGAAAKRETARHLKRVYNAFRPAGN